jgi:signal peptidase
MKTETMLYALVGIGAALVVLSSFSNVLGIFTALGGSMSPAINLGDMIITSGVNTADLKAGDIITFKESTSIITHRIAEVTPDGFVTKGDANDNADVNLVKPEQVIGKEQFVIPFAGYLFHYAKSFYGFLVLVIIPGTIIIVGEVKKISTYRRGSKGQALLLFFGSTILVTMLFSNMISTELYFSDTENVQKQFQAWTEWGPVTNVTKWWSDTEFVPMSDPRYNDAFFVVYHDKTGNVTSTNPGGFFVNINVTLLPNTNSLVITDEIIGSIKDGGDFELQGGRPIQLFLDGVDVTDKFDTDFDDNLMTATLKTEQTIGPGSVLYLKMHLDYAITSLTDGEKGSYPFTYINRATAIIGSGTITKTYHANEVSLIGELKCVDCDPSEVGGLSMMMGGGGSSGGTAPIIEEPVLNETIPDNSTNETNSTAETIPPNITGYKYNVPSLSDYSPAQEYQFNATIVDDTAVDSVWIEHNFTGALANYTVATSAGNEYYYDYASLGIGYYSLKWYANDMAGNLNDTDEVRYYQVNEAAGSVSLLLNGVEGDITLVYGDQINVSGASGYGALTLYRNGTDVTGENDAYVTLAAGYYNYTASSAGDDSHPAVNISRFVTINEAETEPVPEVFHMEVGLNEFTVPSDWAATTAMQLTIDYPLILEISYTDAEGAVVTYAGGAPDTESFDIVAG